SYIHICGRKDPNLDKCVTNSIENLRSYICKGIPELSSPPLELFSINKLVISDSDNAKLYFKDLVVMELCDFIIDSLHLDIDKLHLDINVLLNRIYINGTYDFDIRILVPFVHNGPIYCTSDNVGAKIALDMKLITKNDKKYVYVSKVNLKLDVKTVDIKFDEQDSSQLNKIISTFIGSNQEELIDKARPLLEADISKQILLIANTIVKHFTYDELLPDRA
ncbi:PREDICTED: uncharacterized protein LOC105462033, partial [Wasmannia auropunctata]|uniref:uncharacterized protein LOC105462033 n=1 Tax=Wasmannia auropunctata TaxID=64793 RepID=UPI0005F035D2